MKKFLSTTIAVLAAATTALAVSGCQSPAGTEPANTTGTAGGDQQEPTGSSGGNNNHTGTNQTNTQTINLVYYSLTETSAPVNGWPYKKMTATGSCVQYLTKTYCWDDGLKTLQWRANGRNYGPFNYTYWGIGGTENSWGPCSGGCPSDLLAVPREISVGLAANIPAQEITGVFNLGAAKPVTCTETSAELDCVDFKINLTKEPL
jgi:hypothetical protein